MSIFFIIIAIISELCKQILIKIKAGNKQTNKPKLSNRDKKQGWKMY